MPFTATRLAAASTALFSDVIVTSPVLSVAAAAMVSTVLALSSKSPATAGDSAAADTVTVVARLDAPLNDAVTWLFPPSSPIAVGDSASVTVGVGSSSSSVTVAAAGSPSPTVAGSVPNDSTTLSVPSSSASSVAVTVIVRTSSPTAKTTLAGAE